MTKIEALHKRLVGLGFRCGRHKDAVDIHFGGTLVTVRCSRGTPSFWETETREQIMARCAYQVIDSFTFAGALKRATVPEERAAIIAHERAALQTQHKDIVARIAREEAKAADVATKLAALEGLT